MNTVYLSSLIVNMNTVNYLTVNVNTLYLSSLTGNMNTAYYSS